MDSPISLVVVWSGRLRTQEYHDLPAPIIEYVTVEVAPCKSAFAWLIVFRNVSGSHGDSQLKWAPAAEGV